MMANVTVGAGRVEWIKHNRLALCLMYPLNSHIKANLFAHTEGMLLQHLNILKNPIKPRLGIKCNHSCSNMKSWRWCAEQDERVFGIERVHSCPGRLPCAGFEIAVTLCTSWHVHGYRCAKRWSEACMLSIVILRSRSCDLKAFWVDCSAKPRRMLNIYLQIN